MTGAQQRKCEQARVKGQMTETGIQYNWNGQTWQHETHIMLWLNPSHFVQPASCSLVHLSDEQMKVKASKIKKNKCTAKTCGDFYLHLPAAVSVQWTESHLRSCCCSWEDQHRPQSWLQSEKHTSKNHHEHYNYEVSWSYCSEIRAHRYRYIFINYILNRAPFWLP